MSAEREKGPSIEGRDGADTCPESLLILYHIGGVSWQIFKDINRLAYILAFLHNILLNGTRYRYRYRYILILYI